MPTRLLTVLAFATAVCCLTLTAHAERFDLVLKNGRIIDGTGAPWYIADIGIREGKIAFIGRIPAGDAPRTLDVSGLVVAPGFIDMMGQTVSPCLENPAAALNLLAQGVTTINAGEGSSAAPLDDESAETAGWKSMADYFEQIESQGIPINVAQTVGHTQVRRIVMGDVDRRPTADELEQMKQLVREAMEAGAIGVSTALIYPPAVYATTEEIAELAGVAGKLGGRYYTHMRNEGDQLLEAIDEALEIGRMADTPVHIFHLKAAGRQNWGKMELAIAKIKEARSTGQQVAADIYPYINNGLGIAALIHPRHFAEGRGKLLNRLDDADLRTEIRREMESVGGWENWYRHIGNDWNNIVIGACGDKRYSEHAGKSLGEIARTLGEDPWDTFFALVKTGAFALPQSMSDANKIRAMQQEFVSFCTDVGPSGTSRIASHPRAFGAFPRVLAHYVRGLGVLSLEQAISQMTSVAANEILAFDRGRIAIGQAADLAVFDAERIQDLATLAEPQLLPVGMRYVLVNGELVYEDGELTAARPGRVLRGPGYLDPDYGPTGSFDRLVKSFMKQHHIPGAALAVTRNGRLVHARGYGYADLETRERVRPTSLFRIASISKPITAVAILQLVQEGRLKLDDKVFNVLELETQVVDADKLDARWRDVTIRQLLQHTGGWDRDASFDPMFRAVEIAKTINVPPPAGAKDVIRYMTGQPLDFVPGERYAYSNFGYCLLGRVVERVTEQPYDAYVREHVLAPLDIRRMQIGKTRADGRADGEVRYYDDRTGPSVFAEDLGESVPQPYGAWHLEAMDSHGAWIASPIDLVRFASDFNRPEHSKTLNDESIATMFAAPPGEVGQLPNGDAKPRYYACGWSVRQADDQGHFNSWHTGSLPGTSTLLVRRHDGLNWAIVFNTRNGENISHLASTIDPLLHKAADSVTEWPEGDLFPKYLKD